MLYKSNKNDLDKREPKSKQEELLKILIILLHDLGELRVINMWTSWVVFPWNHYTVREANEKKEA